MTTQDSATTPFPTSTPSALDFTSGDALYIASAAAEALPTLPLTDAVREGLISEADAKITGYRCVTIAEDSRTVVDVGAAAARSAIARAGVPATGIRNVLLASVFPLAYPPIYNVPAAISEAVGVPSAFIAQISNASCTAGLDALILAAHRLLLTGDPTALVVAADLWRMPHIDRFNVEQGYILSDGGTAVVLSREAGYAQLIASATLTDPALSGLHSHVPSDRTPVDVTARARAFLKTRMGTEVVLPRRRAGLDATIDACLAQAGIGLADVDHVVVPAIGEPFLKRNYVDPLDIPVSRTTWDYTEVTGHIGAADQFGALAHLVDRGRCRSGDVILMIAEGAGFQWSVMLLKVQ
ncbi:3-oxoacyl-[acyl-carrier-protein] synthase III C-terminal domain-containing protein [Streptomyces sp. B8F3]|uniref:3-oxoacyl-[acyl-carrier-protein] synthase III C-terminal domain-containing protein n=1 Tax=unclassified Streptomyces TaxID=2593676 RepID=UPI00325E7C61